LHDHSHDLHDELYDLHDELHKGASVMKKILLLIAAVVGALAIQKKFKDQQAEQDLWAEATDKV
jgi:hypothetical protein